MSPRVEQMDDVQLRTEVVKCITRIHVITGWGLPGDTLYMGILTDELQAKLAESFPQLNFDQIAHAMRKYGVGKKDWGKNMNLELICDVLSMFSADASRVFADELKALSGQALPVSDENTARHHIQAYYRRLWEGTECSAVMPNEEIHRRVLLKDQLIGKKESMYEFFQRYLVEEKTAIYYTAEEIEGRDGPFDEAK